MVNNIRNNTISEIDAKKDLNALNKIKNVEIIKFNNKEIITCFICTPGHKKLLNLFNDLLDIILIDKALESESQENENENEKVERRKEENEDDDYKNKNEDEYENENENDGETMSQNKKKRK